MMYNQHGKALGIGDAETIAEWFVVHMTQEQRALFMAERPMVYHRLFPEVRMSVITERIARQW